MGWRAKPSASIHRIQTAAGTPFRVHYRTADGLQRGRTFPTYRDAETFRDEVRLEVRTERGRLRAATASARVDPPITVKAYGEQRWLPAAIKPKTLDSYESNFRLHVMPALGELRVKDVTHGDVLALLEAKLRAQLAPNTVRLVHATIRRLLTRARLDGVVRENVAIGVWRELPKGIARRRKSRRPEDVEAMTRDQVAAFLEAAKAIRPRRHVLWLTQYRLGLRPGEVLGLKLSTTSPSRRAPSRSSARCTRPGRTASARARRRAARPGR